MPQERPDWTTLPASTPAPIRKLLRRCLEKDRKKRFESAADARLEIADALTAAAGDVSAASAVLPHAAWRRALHWTLASVLLVGLGLVSFIHFREQPPFALEPVRFEIFPPERINQVSGLTVSPDGRLVLFLGRDADGVTRLWIRSLDALEARALTGTVGVTGAPFWSPDSRFVGFGVTDKLKKIDVSGGPPQTVCDLSGTLLGGFWTQDGRIVFGSGNSGLRQVPAVGGLALPLTALDTAHGERSHGSPALLPDGRHFVYTRTSGSAERSGIFIGSLNARPDQQGSPRLLADDSPSVFAPLLEAGVAPGRGYLVFRREDVGMAQAFDAARLELSGDPIAIAGSARDLGVSRNGVLTYSSGNKTAGPTSLTWYDRHGKNLGTAGLPGEYNSVDLSPDAKQVAVDRTDSGNRDLWLIEFVRGSTTRFTFDPTNALGPVWSPDGSRIAWASVRRNRSGGGLHLKSSSGGAEEVLVEAAHVVVPFDWSRDGRFLIYYELDPKTKRDLRILPMEGDRKPQVFLQTEFNETEARFSPDARWVVYQSDESGKYEIYVRPFPAQTGMKFAISSGGGYQPRWSRNGKEIFYFSGDGKLMAADVTASATFTAGVPHVLFQAPILGNGVTEDLHRWDVTSDGQRFLINTVSGERASARMITVVVNWQEGLKKWANDAK